MPTAAPTGRASSPMQWASEILSQVMCILKAVVLSAAAHLLQDFSPRFLLEWLQDATVLHAVQFALCSCPASVLAAETGVLLQSSGVAHGQVHGIQAERRFPGSELGDTGVCVCSALTIPSSNERKQRQCMLFFILSSSEDGHWTRCVMQKGVSGSITLEICHLESARNL